MQKTAKEKKNDGGNGKSQRIGGDWKLESLPTIGNGWRLPYFVTVFKWRIENKIENKLKSRQLSINSTLVKVKSLILFDDWEVKSKSDPVFFYFFFLSCFEKKNVPRQTVTYYKRGDTGVIILKNILGFTHYPIFFAKCIAYLQKLGSYWVMSGQKLLRPYLPRE